MSDTNRVGVVGGGLGGLAAACVLAARGYPVVLFEANPWLGGKAAVLEEAGFRFDMGPTILTLPDVLRRIFAEAGHDLNDYLPLVRLDPQWRCLYEDGSVLDLVEGTEAMAGRLDEFAPGTHAGANYREFMHLSERLQRITERHFFWKSVGGPRDMLRNATSFSGLLADTVGIRPGRTVAGTVRRAVREPRVAQMLDHFTQYVGSSPFGSPAVLCGIGRMQTAGGVWYPRGGTRAVPDALIRLATELGVDLRPGVGVKRIVVEGGSVRGVVTETGERVPLAAVVSNADSVRTHWDLLDSTDSRPQTHEPACSGVVLYLGLKQRYDHLLHHNFVFSRDPHEEFDFIYTKGEPAPDPTCYLAATARTEPDTAPPNGEALYVLVHAPYLRPHHDWSRMLPEYRRVILNKLKTTGRMPDIEERIVFESVLTPQDIHERYRVLNGAIYGLASHGRWFGAFKPANRSRQIRGLYFAGGAAHPGPGMPMVIMSGWIAADALDQDGIISRQEAKREVPLPV